MTRASVLLDLSTMNYLPSLGWMGDRELLSDDVLDQYLIRMKELEHESTFKNHLLGRGVRRGLSEEKFRWFMGEYNEYIWSIDVSGCESVNFSSLPLLDLVSSISCGNCGLTSIMEIASLVEICEHLTFIHLHPANSFIPGSPNRLPSSLTRLSPHEAVQYIREFQSASDPLTEVRLVLLGHGTAGKTTLKLSLQEEESETSEKSSSGTRRCRILGTKDRTNGVNVNELWSIKDHCPEESWPHQSLSPSIHILDFPGQSEFYSSNRLLLSSLELTVCLVAARLVPVDVDFNALTTTTLLRQAMDTQWKLNETQLSFWLTMLNDMSRYEATASGNLDSQKPVYVVFTCADLADLPYALELRDNWVKRNENRYPHLRLCSVSCVAGREIDSEGVCRLRSSLVNTALSMMEEQAVPRSIKEAEHTLHQKWRHMRLVPTQTLKKMIRDLLKTDQPESVSLILKSLQVTGRILPIDSVGVTVVDPFWLSLVVNKVVSPIELGGVSCGDSGQPHIVTRAALHKELNKLVSMLHHLLAAAEDLTEVVTAGTTDVVISREAAIQECLDHPSSSPNSFEICFESEVQILSAGFLGRFRRYKSRYVVVVSPGYVFKFERKQKWDDFRDGLARGIDIKSSVSLLRGRGVFLLSPRSLNIAHIDSDIYTFSLQDLTRKHVPLRVKLNPIQRDAFRAGMAHAMPLDIEESKLRDTDDRDHNSVDVICEVLQSLDVMFLLANSNVGTAEYECQLDPSSDRFLVPSRLMEEAPEEHGWKDQLKQYESPSLHQGVDGVVVNVIRFSSARKDPFPPALIGRIVFALYDMPSIKKQENFLTIYRRELHVIMSSGTEVLFRFAPNDLWFDVALVCTSREESEVDVPLVIQALVELLDGRCAEVSNVRLPFCAAELCLTCVLDVDGKKECHSQAMELHGRETVELVACRSSFFTGCSGGISIDLKRLHKELSFRETELRARQASQLQGWSEWSTESGNGSVLRLIPMQEVEGIKCVSDGNFGVVFEGQYKSKRVAIKAPKRHVQADEQWREFSLWSSLPRHANICPLLGFCESFAFDTPSDAALVEDPSLKPLAYRSLTSRWKTSGRRRQSFLEKPGKTSDWTRVQAHDSMMLPFVGPSLLNIAHGSNGHTLDEETTLMYLMDVARALVVLHEKRVVHRDIALRNVLVFEDGRRACLTDFGLSAKGKPRKIQHRSEDDSKTDGVETPDFSVKMTRGMFPVRLFAPEVFLTMEYGPEADVYMFGWMVANLLQKGSEPEWRDIYENHYYEIVVGSKSFKEKLKHDRIHLDMDEALDGMNQEWKRALHPLIKACTLEDPSQRLSMRAVYDWLSHHSVKNAKVIQESPQDDGNICDHTQ